MRLAGVISLLSFVLVRFAKLCNVCQLYLVILLGLVFGEWGEGEVPVEGAFEAFEGDMSEGESVYLIISIFLVKPKLKSTHLQSPLQSLQESLVVADLLSHSPNQLLCFTPDPIFQLSSNAFAKLHGLRFHILIYLHLVAVVENHIAVAPENIEQNGQPSILAFWKLEYAKVFFIYRVAPHISRIVNQIYCEFIPIHLPLLTSQTLVFTIFLRSGQASAQSIRVNLELLGAFIVRCVLALAFELFSFLLGGGVVSVVKVKDVLELILKVPTLFIDAKQLTINTQDRTIPFLLLAQHLRLLQITKQRAILSFFAQGRERRRAEIPLMMGERVDRGQGKRKSRIFIFFLAMHEGWEVHGQAEFVIYYQSANYGNMFQGRKEGREEGKEWSIWGAMKRGQILSFLSLLLALASQSPLPLPELSVCIEYAVPKSKVGSVISSILTMMKIVKVVLAAEGEELKRSPSKVVSAMAVESIPHPKDEPDEESTNVDGANEGRGYLHTEHQGEGLADEELDGVEVQPCYRYTGLVLVMDLMVFVEDWLMHKVMA